MCCLALGMVHAQTASVPASFQATDSYGNTCYYYIHDAANNYVTMLPDDGVTSGNQSTFNTSGPTATIPASVVYNGTTYYVKKLENLMQTDLRHNNCDTVYISEGIEEVDGFLWCGGKVCVLPTTLKRAGQGAFGENWNTESYVGLENTQLTTISWGLFNQNFTLKSPMAWILPKTTEIIETSSLPALPWQRNFEIPASVTSIDFGFLDDVFYNVTDWSNFFKVINLEAATPPALPNYNMSQVTRDGFTYYNWNGYGLFTRQQVSYSRVNGQSLVSSVTYYTPDSLYVPVDATAAYEGTAGWDMYDGKYFEKVVIGPHGYTSYYLENENFLVPAGCTAYIVTDATAVTGSYGNAVVKAFPAGSIIPKQTGFILEGVANSTVVYQANVSGTEVDVTGNLLVGTAVEKQFSGGNYKYYIFGNGSLGQGFYYQGTRGGNSINVKAHRAGLRLPTSGFAPAKGFVIDFEAAKNNATTGISTINTEVGETGNTTIYDLQGRVVTNPKPGLYIVNGKKVVIK